MDGGKCSTTAALLVAIAVHTVCSPEEPQIDRSAQVQPLGRSGYVKITDPRDGDNFRLGVPVPTSIWIEADPRTCAECICIVCLEFGGKQLSCGDNRVPHGKSFTEIDGVLDFSNRVPGSYMLTAKLVARRDDERYHEVIHEDAVTILVAREFEREYVPAVIENRKQLVAEFGMAREGRREGRR